MKEPRNVRSWTSRLFGFLRRDEMEARLRAETAFHLEMAIDKNIRAGMSPEDARAAATSAFGSRGRWDAEARDEYRSRALEDFSQDIRYAWRSLRHSPSFTLAAIATLALSIGATTSIFSVVNTVLLKSLPYPEPDRIAVMCEQKIVDGGPSCNVLNRGNFVTFRGGKSFVAAGAFGDGPVALSGKNIEPVSAYTRFATSGLFTVLGARAAHGRLTISADDTVGAPNVVVLSHAFWRRQFGGDTGIVGQSIQLNAFDYTVIGVTAPEVRFLAPVDIWVPMRFSAQVLSAGGRSIQAIARLKPGVSFETASQEMASMAAARAEAFPAINKNWTALVVPLKESIVGSSQQTLWMLLGAVGFLLVIACANVANLMLARASAREREVAVRVSLGASPWRITRQLLTESIVLSVIASVLGLLLAIKGTDALAALVPTGVAGQGNAAVAVDWRVLVFTGVVAIGAGLFFGIAPAMHATRANIQTTLKDGGRGAGASRSAARLRNTLVVAEISLALVLLMGAGLMVRTLSALQKVTLGFEPAHALAASIQLPNRKYNNDTVRVEFFRAAEERVRAIRGVKAVGAISYLPLSGMRSASGFNVEGRPPAPVGHEPVGDMRAVTPGYFEAMGIEIKEGRGLTDHDLATTASVGLVSESLAKQFWPNESAVGHYLIYEWGPMQRVEIVGVAADVHHEAIDKAPALEIYRPLTQFVYGGMTIVTRVDGEPAAFTGAFRNAIREIDPELPIAQLRPMDEFVRDGLGRTRLSTTLFASFGFLGLLLAAVGIYGVMSYTVELRQREIGIRMALGAEAREVLGSVIMRGAKLAVAGIFIGAIGGMLATKLMSKLLYGVEPGDLRTFFITSSALAIVALVATYLPGRRATQVDPVSVLRGD